MVQISAVQAIVQVVENGYSCNASEITARKLAVSSLVLYAQRGDERALVSLRQSLRDWHVAIREAAVEGFIRILQQSDRSALNARQHAVQALAPVCKEGSKTARAVLIAALEDVDSVVRCEALNVLVRIAKEGDNVKPAEVGARVAAIEALTPLAQRGDRIALAVLTKCSNDWHVAVNRAAKSALAIVLQDELRGESILDEEALNALARSAKSGDTNALAALKTRLEHGPDLSRRMVIEILANLAEEGDSEKAGAVKARVSAVEALVIVAINGDDRAAGALSVSVKDWHVEVRRAATAGLIKVLGDEHGDQTSSARCIAVAALIPIARSGHKEAGAALNAQVGRWDA